MRTETLLGLWNLSGTAFRRKLSAREGRSLIKAAYKKGIRWFDSAYSYQEADSLLSAAMRELGALDWKVVEKVMPVPTLKKKAETSLSRLGRERLDILLLHWPTDKDLYKSLKELERLKGEGKAEEIGVSNFPASLLEKVLADFPIAYHERALSLAFSKDWQEEKAMPVKTIAYSPLASGLLAGKTREGLGYPDLSLVRERVPKPSVALSWVYGEKPWGVVSGFSSPGQLSILDEIEELPDQEELSVLSSKVSGMTACDNCFGHDWRTDAGTT